MCRNKAYEHAPKIAAKFATDSFAVVCCLVGCTGGKELRFNRIPRSVHMLSFTPPRSCPLAVWQSLTNVVVLQAGKAAAAAVAAPAAEAKQPSAAVASAAAAALPPAEAKQ